MKGWKMLATAVLFAAGVFGCAGVNRGPGAPDLPRRIADAYGVQAFGRVEAIRFTFNASVGGKQVHRSWVWYPETSRVTADAGQMQGVTYSRDYLETEQLKTIDSQFINDQYWLLFPFHLVWDSGIKVTDEGKSALPIGSGTARRLQVAYPQTGGYTPGDVYELYVGAGDRIVQWIYRRGGAPEPTRIAAWKDYRKVGPLTLSLDRPGKSPDFHVWFTGVAVRLVGESEWIPAAK